MVGVCSFNNPAQRLKHTSLYSLASVFNVIGSRLRHLCLPKSLKQQSVTEKRARFIAGMWLLAQATCYTFPDPIIKHLLIEKTISSKVHLSCIMKSPNHLNLSIKSVLQRDISSVTKWYLNLKWLSNVQNILTQQDHLDFWTYPQPSLTPLLQLSNELQ